jgi:transcriptional regulator GlxA family with amidase domain
MNASFDIHDDKCSQSPAGVYVNLIAFLATSTYDPATMKRRPRQVWFIVFPGSEMLDLSGPWAVLSYTNEVIEREVYNLSLISPLGGETRTRHGLALSDARPLGGETAVGAPDIVVIAGGATECPLPPSETRAARWLRKRYRSIPTLISICTGAFVLGEAGLLDGRRATTHWRHIDVLRQRFPKAHVVDDDIFLRDGRVWTSAGITAGIDLMLALVESDHGHAIAMAVAKTLVLFLRRSGRQAQFSQMLKRQEGEPARLRDLSAFILEHLNEPLPIEELAWNVGMSVRTLTRWCRRELGESPAALVRRLRIEEAQRLLEQTSLPLKDIAVRINIGDTSTLWRLFTRELGITPAEYRARFASASAST